MRIARPKATIVAFDGLVVDSLQARAHAIAEAITAEFAQRSAADIAPVLAGRSLDEAVEAALVSVLVPPGDVFDATVRDLAVLRARRAYSAIVAQGLPMRDGAVEWLRARASSSGRIVLRADSVRRDVEQLLALSGIESLISFARCADDQPRNLAEASVENSFRAVLDRVASQGVEPIDCAVFEYDLASAEVARNLGATAERADALR